MRRQYRPPGAPLETGPTAAGKAKQRYGAKFPVRIHGADNTVSHCAPQACRKVNHAGRTRVRACTASVRTKAAMNSPVMMTTMVGAGALSIRKLM